MPPNDPPIKFIRVPANGDPMKIVKEKTTNITMDKSCSTFPLGHIPDVKEFWKWSNAAWAGRTVCIYNFPKVDEDPEGIMEGTWILLTNRSPTSGLPLNMNENWSNNENRNVWGDAFICKLGKNPIINGRAQYVNVKKAAIGDKELKWMMESDPTGDGHDIFLDADGNYAGLEKSDPVEAGASKS